MIFNITIKSGIKEREGKTFANLYVDIDIDRYRFIKILYTLLSFVLYGICNTVINYIFNTLEQNGISFFFYIKEDSFRFLIIDPLIYLHITLYTD